MKQNCQKVHDFHWNAIPFRHHYHRRAHYSNFVSFFSQTVLFRLTFCKIYSHCHWPRHFCANVIIGSFVFLYNTVTFHIHFILILFALGELDQEKNYFRSANLLHVNQLFKIKSLVDSKMTDRVFNNSKCIFAYDNINYERAHTIYYISCR